MIQRNLAALEETRKQKVNAAPQPKKAPQLGAASPNKNVRKPMGAQAAAGNKNANRPNPFNR